MTTKAKSSAARYEELAQERRRLEAQAEEGMRVLVEALDKIRDLDPEQRRAAVEAGMYDPKAEIKPTLHEVLGSWIGARLGGPEGYVGLLKRRDYERPLPELDRLAGD